MAKNKQQVIQLTEAPEIRFGDRLRVLRRALHLDQDEMGELLEIDGGRYGNWEACSAKPRDLVATAQLIERKTGCPAEWLLGLRTGSFLGALTCIALPKAELALPA